VLASVHHPVVGPRPAIASRRSLSQLRDPRGRGHAVAGEVVSDDELRAYTGQDTVFLVDARGTGSGILAGRGGAGDQAEGKE
jgi:hypothetical protein